jgi:HSP20 family protein
MASRDRRDFQGMYRAQPGTTGSSSDPNTSGAWLDPLSQFRRLTDQMDRWFDTMGVGRTATHTPSREHPWSDAPDLWAPELETFLRGDQFTVRMDLPGVKKEDVNVEVTDDAIVIHGERQQTHQEERDGFYRSERTYGRFYREVPLPEGAQPDSAKANYRDGVLEISVTAPPRQLLRPRRVEIGGAAPGERQDRAEMTAGREQRSGSATERVSIAHDVQHGEPMD